MQRLALLLAVTATAACGGSTSSTPTIGQYDDTAQTLGPTTATGSGGGETGSMGDVVMLAAGKPVSGFTTAADGSYTGSHDGLGYTYTLTCSDRSGAALGSCGRTTASADAKVGWAGTLLLPTLTTTVTRTGDWQLTGVDGPTAKLDGTSSLELATDVTSIFRQGDTKYDVVADARYANVEIDTTTLAITGGEIDYDVTSTMHSTAGQETDADHIEVDADITFAADGTAMLVLDGQHSYRIDETTGVVVKID